MVVTDAVVRLLPGALGDELSSVDESFSTAEGGGLLEYAQYTRPAEFEGNEVPRCCSPAITLRSPGGAGETPSSARAAGAPDLIPAAELTDEERLYAEELLRRYHGDEPIE